MAEAHSSTPRIVAAAAAVCVAALLAGVSVASGADHPSVPVPTGPPVTLPGGVSWDVTSAPTTSTFPVTAVPVTTPPVPPVTTVPTTASPVVTVPPVTVAVTTPPPFSMPNITKTLPPTTVATVAANGAGPATPAPLIEVPTTALVLVDDTDTVSVAVPEDWIQIDTAPVPSASGGLVSRLIASPDLGAFIPPEGVDPFVVSGVMITAGPRVADTSAVMAAFGLESACRAGPVSPYDDTVLTGSYQVFTDCGGRATRVVTMVVQTAASPAFYLRIQTAVADDRAVSIVVSSLLPR